VGLDKGDDAGVYRLSDELALIQTVDFFTPIVDDPYLFGQVAAANALSDVYAMGGRPVTAMNIVCFPSKTLEIGVLHEVLRGGIDKLKEAGALLVGGHSIDDPELKYGLSVTGVVHPERLWTNQGARVGDRLILTKPLGTGIVSTAHKQGRAEAAFVERMIVGMVALNQRACEVMQEHGHLHACTDVTGFGLIGHLCEMVEGSRVGIAIESSQVPLLPGALQYSQLGLLPGGLRRNKDFRSPLVQPDPAVAGAMLDLLYDPQTSGGLLAAVPAREAPGLVQRMRGAGLDGTTIIGEVVEHPAGQIVVR
jgi:selenide,water dikinase